MPAGYSQRCLLFRGLWGQAIAHPKIMMIMLRRGSLGHCGHMFWYVWLFLSI